MYFNKPRLFVGWMEIKRATMDQKGERSRGGWLYISKQIHGFGWKRVLFNRVLSALPSPAGDSHGTRLRWIVTKNVFCVYALSVAGSGAGAGPITSSTHGPVTGAWYSGTRKRQFLGHVSTQELQAIHRSLSIVHFLSAFSTVIASETQCLSHNLQ